MALVKNPLMSYEAAGSVAGVTYSKGPGGAQAKRKPIPSASMWGMRPRIRSILGWLSRQWASLSDLQRESWRDWALDHPGSNKFGDPFIMSGANAYVMLNHAAVRLFGVGAENDLPPVDPPVSSIEKLTGITGAVSAGDVDLSWTELGTGIAGDKWEIQMAGPFQSPGRVEVMSRFAFKQDVAGNVLLDTVSGLDEGFWYWFRVRYVALDGQVTAWQYAQATPKVTV